MLSVIIPTLNEEQHLPLLLESLQKQSFKDFEVIVADAGSKDKTRSIARSYGCRIVQGGRLPVGRNNGALASKKKYLLFVDADAVLKPHCLATLIRQMKRYTVASGSVWPHDGSWMNKAMCAFTNRFHYYLQFFYPHCPESGCLTMLPREVWKRCGGYDERLDIFDFFS